MNWTLPEAEVAALERAALASVRGHTVLVLCGGEDEEASISLAAADPICETLGRLGLPHRKIRPEQLLVEIAAAEPKIVVNILYGPTGEGGGIAGLLEGLAVPYTYSGPTSSAISIDKWRSKLVLDGAARLTWSEPFNRSSVAVAAGAVAARGTWPVICKPLRQGSSVGVVKVAKFSELECVLTKLSEAYGEGIVEPYLPGDEFTVAVLQIPGRGPVALPPMRITGADIASTLMKYGDGSLSLECPAKIGPSLAAELAVTALSAFKRLGCRPLARVDFRCDAEGAPHLLEVNHHPGMTPHSWFPKIAAQAGIGYDTLLLLLLNDALRRRSERAGISFALTDLSGAGVISAVIIPTSGYGSGVAVELPEKPPKRRRITAGAPSVAIDQAIAAFARSRERPLLFDLIYNDDDTATAWRALADGFGFARIGPSILCCALSDDKIVQRTLARSLGIPQPYWALLSHVRKEVPNTVVLKPRRGAYSEGVSLLVEGQLADHLLEGDPEEWLVEGYAEGEEIHVGIICSSDKAAPRTLPLARMIDRGQPWVFDQAMKAELGQLQLHFVSADSDAYAGIVHLSKLLWLAFDRPPIARVEWRLSESGHVNFIEFDHCPGLEDTSIVVRMMDNVGITPAEALFGLTPRAEDQ